MTMIRIWVFLTLILSVFELRAQNIGIIGSFNNWSEDVFMNTTDGIIFTLS